MKTKLMAASALCVLLASSCSGPKDANGGQGADPTPSVKKQEPVTVTAAIDGTYDEQFAETLSRHVKNKYPNVTLDMLNSNGGNKLDNLLASNMIPDIIFTYNGNLKSYKDKGLLYDLKSLMKEANVPEERFEANYMADIRNAVDGNAINGLPYETTFHALFYNKGIFDMFGVPYPKAGMTWDDVYELAKRVTRQEGGVQYRGVDPGSGVIWISQPLSIAAVDYRTEKASVKSDQWRMIFELVKKMYDIPGNTPVGAPLDQFTKTKTLAMIGQLNIFGRLADAEKEGMDWDVTQYPSFKERPNTFGNASVSVAIITQTSKHKEAAMQVLDVLTSDAYQTERTRGGAITTLRSPGVKAEFGKDVPSLTGKHVEDIFKSKPVPYPTASMYRSKAESLLKKEFDKFAAGGMDVNTALNQADEAINKLIEAERIK
ncbi:extracellular solute-binding protein [Paenibacillus hemerocallicola]|uniref:Extracellular solute-binding protein n=1 Tax=Paenibacillus hemerocallicola TaxID=1172614 RepID=A0A5C4TFN0_9BACL|nr:extracellular solute-binding protein [Paenibacillus hemerocallicola]TNJ67851.1 extracellular solute-binding protein [Paenibacillus hemerocallicola]